MDLKLLCLLSLALSCAVPQPVSKLSEFFSSLTKTPSCSSNDPLPICYLKRAQCLFVDRIVLPSGSTVKVITACANATGLSLSPESFLYIGTAYFSGYLDSLAQFTSSTKETSKLLKKCVLSSAGLLTPDFSLNRTAVLAKLALQNLPTNLSLTLENAVRECPDITDYQISIYLDCLRARCMDAVKVSPFMSLGLVSPFGLAASFGSLPW